MFSHYRVATFWRKLRRPKIVEPEVAVALSASSAEAIRELDGNLDGNVEDPQTSAPQSELTLS